MLMFGVVDRLTWGGWFASYISYVKFNLIEGGASIFGTLPWKWYWTQFYGRLPIGLPILGLLSLLGIRRNWPFVISALGLAVLLSTQAHKEERFLMLFWPLILIAAAAGAGAQLAHRPAQVLIEGAPFRPRRWRTRIVRVALVVAIPIVLADGARHCRGNDFADLWTSRYEAQVWAARQADMRGLLVDMSLYTGGYMWFSRSLPLLTFETKLLGNPLFSHVLVPRDSGERREAERAGFTEVFRKDEMVVLRRNPQPTGP